MASAKNRGGKECKPQRDKQCVFGVVESPDPGAKVHVDKQDAVGAAQAVDV